MPRPSQLSTSIGQIAACTLCPRSGHQLPNDSDHEENCIFKDHCGNLLYNITDECVSFNFIAIKTGLLSPCTERGRGISAGPIRAVWRVVILASERRQSDTASTCELKRGSGSRCESSATPTSASLCLHLPHDPSHVLTWCQSYLKGRRRQISLQI